MEHGKDKTYTGNSRKFQSFLHVLAAVVGFLVSITVQVLKRKVNNTQRQLFWKLNKVGLCEGCDIVYERRKRQKKKQHSKNNNDNDKNQVLRIILEENVCLLRVEHFRYCTERNSILSVRKGQLF